MYLIGQKSTCEGHESILVLDRFCKLWHSHNTKTVNEIRCFYLSKVLAPYVPSLCCGGVGKARAPCLD